MNSIYITAINALFNIKICFSANLFLTWHVTHTDIVFKEAALENNKTNIQPDLAVREQEDLTRIISTGNQRLFSDRRENGFAKRIMKIEKRSASRTGGEEKALSPK